MSDCIPPSSSAVLPPRRPGRFTIRAVMRGYAGAFMLGAYEGLKDRVDLAVSALFLGLLLTIFAVIYAVIPMGGLPMDGLTRAHLLWYFAIAECVMFGVPAANMFGLMIREGRLEEMMQRPLQVPLFVLAWGMGMHCVRVLLCFGFALVVLPLFMNAPFPLPVWMVPLLIASLVLGGLLLQMLCYLTSTLEIYGDFSYSFGWMMHKMVFAFGGLFFPVLFYPPFVQKVVAFTPFPSTLFSVGLFMLPVAPAQMMAGTGMQIVWSVVMLGVMLLVHRRMARVVLVRGI